MHVLDKVHLYLYYLTHNQLLLMGEPRIPLYGLRVLIGCLIALLFIERSDCHGMRI